MLSSLCWLSLTSGLLTGSFSSLLFPHVWVMLCFFPCHNFLLKTGHFIYYIEMMVYIKSPPLEAVVVVVCLFICLLLGRIILMKSTSSCVYRLSCYSPTEPGHKSHPRMTLALVVLSLTISFPGLSVICLHWHHFQILSSINIWLIILPFFKVP